tara:strand:- start:234 stop:422 length:189 start_codon:yes stop_codon:yes gene_type:complete
VVQLGLVDILLDTIQVVRTVEVELADRIVEVAGRHKLVVGLKLMNKLMVTHKLVELELVDHQ